MNHYIKENKYYIEDTDGNIVLTISLYSELEGNQITIETEKEVYSGPVALLEMSYSNEK